MSILSSVLISMAIIDCLVDRPFTDVAQGNVGYCRSQICDSNAHLDSRACPDRHGYCDPRNDGESRKCKFEPVYHDERLLTGRNLTTHSAGSVLAFHSHRGFSPVSEARHTKSAKELSPR